MRWWIVWTLFFSTVTNYISRQTFSVRSPMIAAQYHLSHTDLAKIVGAFQFSYAVTWLLGGIFLDAAGTRPSLALRSRATISRAGYPRHRHPHARAQAGDCRS
jgi:ACS family hexuronate transporter-like MFS transporter